MQPRLQATLADFVPALRFVAPELVADYLEHENLPAAWWMSVPVVRAADTFGRDELPGRLADLAYTELRHLRLGDLLPGAWLARNGFRLSQWPDGARTNVMVRTPDWADLLTTTVREVGDWTQIGTSTVRPLVARLFEEVLGLLPADDESVDADAVFGVPDTAASEPVPALASASAVEAQPEPTPTEPEAEPTPEPTPEPVPAAPSAVMPAPPIDGDWDTPDDWGDLDEDELRPVKLPEPLTAELGTVVRWLAAQAPDVPLMAQLAQVTLETAAVVGLEDASEEVRTALTALLTQVPSGLRASLAMPPAAPETGEAAAEPSAPPASTPETAAGRDAYGEVPPPTRADVSPARPADPKPAAKAEPRSAPEPHAPGDRSDEPAIGSGSGSRREPVIRTEDTFADAPPRATSAEPAAEDDRPGLDAFGETPPMTVADIPIRTIKDRGPADAPAGPAPESTSKPAGAGSAEDPGQDAFGEIPPPTAGRMPAVGESEAPRTPEGLRIPPRPSHPPRTAPAPTSVPEPAAGATAAEVPSVPAPPDHSVVPRTNRGTKAAAADPEATVEMVPGALPATEDVTMLVDRPPQRAGEPGGGDPVTILGSWFTTAEPQRKVLARDRLFTDAPRELESLAAEFGISPAEVKIMERDLRRNLDERIARSEGAPVRVHLSFVRDRLGVLTTVSELRALHPKHTEIVPGLEIQVWQVLRGLLGLHTSVDGWLSGAPLGELSDRTQNTLDAACAHGPVPLRALERDLAAMGIRKPLQTAWISRLEGFQVENGQVLSRSADTLERPAQKQQPAPIGDPSWTAGCFREDTGAWAFRVDVSTAMLEGEPVKLPVAFAQALGVTAGGQVRLHHGHGPAALRWSDTPYLVSLRAILAGLSAHEGDMVFISSIHQGRLEARLVRGDATVRLPRWARALRHTGVDPVPEQVNLPELLGARIGLDPGIDLKAVLHRLQQRGDTDVLELLGVTQPRP
ncbi:hypothetical protein [Embleya scabrispora]|uniref:hypothetical protein n=1 Tax=Embleya scabrispora TaxID=159449 RepID=UPI00039FD904|nr:hypothetical protein [Embleya scabrispora]MYS81699.1 hypothetical protein [Streptomyces sp. SID5474]